MPGRILIVDDDLPMCAVLETGLARRGYTVSSRNSGDAALDVLSEQEFDAVVTDLNMKGMNGLDLCSQIAALRPALPVLVITAFGSLDSAVAAIRAGAYDFITKPFEMEALTIALERAVQHRALREEVKRLRFEAASAKGFGELVGVSRPMQELRDLLGRIAPLDTTVLLTGESGTGKEIVATELHRASARRSGPWVAVNCAAMPELLLESELFGHTRGAFTDARTARTGLFLKASGGTLFLDEIGEMPISLQPKLLRCLQERKVRPVGSEEEIPFDVRLIAATNRDLEELVEQKRFREDLYFRINVIQVALPPLRVRGNDVLLLAQRFLAHFAQRTGKRIVGLTPEAAASLLAYSWPGNVRELSNCIERAVALTRFEQLSVEDLPDKVRSYKRSQLVFESDDLSTLLPMDEVERRYVLRVLELTAGNKSLAAQILGLDRKTLYRKLVRYGAVSDDDGG